MEETLTMARPKKKPRVTPKKSEKPKDATPKESKLMTRKDDAKIETFELSKRDHEQQSEASAEAQTETINDRIRDFSFMFEGEEFGFAEIDRDVYANLQSAMVFHAGGNNRMVRTMVKRILKAGDYDRFTEKLQDLLDRQLEERLAWKENPQDGAEEPLNVDTVMQDALSDLMALYKGVVNPKG